MTTIILSYAGELTTVEGHSHTYHTAVSMALCTVGHKYHVLVPETYAGEEDIFYKALKKITPRPADIRSPVRRKIAYLRDALRLASAFRRFIRELNPPNDRVCVFLEASGNLLEQFCLILLSRPFNRNQRYVYLIRSYSERPTYRLASWIQYRMILLILRSRIVFATDSSLLSRKLTQTLSYAPHVLPVPHGSWKIDFNKTRDVHQTMIWAFSINGREKGAELLPEIMHLCAKQKGIKFYVNGRHFDIDIQDRSAIIQLLYPSEDLYLESLRDCRFALLLYDPLNTGYALSTSGVFIEAVSNGVIPLVRDGTWMASELKNFGLEKLIFQGNGNEMAERIVSVITKRIELDTEIYDRLSDMRNQYVQTHNPANFRVEFLKLLEYV